jgi:predicted DNA-binding ArsR family transcriptional regulator
MFPDHDRVVCQTSAGRERESHKTGLNDALRGWATVEVLVAISGHDGRTGTLTEFACKNARLLNTQTRTTHNAMVAHNDHQCE